MIVIKCARCNQQINLDLSLAGDTVDCPHCGNVNRVPSDSRSIKKKQKVDANKRMEDLIKLSIVQANLSILEKQHTFFELYEAASQEQLETLSLQGMNNSIVDAFGVSNATESAKGIVVMRQMLDESLQNLGDPPTAQEKNTLHIECEAAIKKWSFTLGMLEFEIKQLRGDVQVVSDDDDWWVPVVGMTICVVGLALIVFVIWGLFSGFFFGG